MAILFDADADFLSRTTGLPAFGDWSVMMWMYRSATGAAFENYFYLETSQGGAYLGIYGSQAGVIQLDSMLGSTSGTGATIPLQTWTHLALVFDNTANTIVLYVNGALNVTLTAATGTATWGFEILASYSGGGSERMVGRMGAYKSWTAVLSAAQVAAEMRYYQPVRTANLHRWSPLMDATDLRDYANGVSWTAAGTLTTDPGPPIAWAPRPRTHMVRAPIAAGILETRLERRVPTGLHRGILRGVA